MFQRKTSKVDAPKANFDSTFEKSVKVNQYEWGDSKLQARDNKVYYRSLKIIGSSETIEIKTGSHIMIENQD